MLYRLAFNITTDGYLRITAVAKELPPASAVHLNGEVFAAVVNLAKIAPFQTSLIRSGEKSEESPDS